MAHLNDFFAKKDKKRLKGTKFTTLKDIEKKLEVMDKKKDLEKELKDKNLDDEWKIVEEQLKDYTGLKIQNTIISDKDDEESDSDKMEKSCNPPFCPWIVEKTEDENPIIQEDSYKSDLTHSKVLKKEETKTSKYIPPHLRNKLKLAESDSKNKDNKIINEADIMFPELPAPSLQHKIMQPEIKKKYTGTGSETKNESKNNKNGLTIAQNESLK